MSTSILVDALTQIATHPASKDGECVWWHHAEERHSVNCGVAIAREALAAHRAAPLVGLNRDSLAEAIYHAGDVNIPWITALRAADAVLRIVDEHLGRK